MGIIFEERKQDYLELFNRNKKKIKLEFIPKFFAKSGIEDSEGKLEYYEEKKIILRVKKMI